MTRRISVYGLLAGALVGIPTFVLFVARAGAPPLAYGMVIGYLTMLVALSMVFAGIKRRRDSDLGGVIGFWPALGVGLGISVVAGLCYCAAWEAALAVTHIDFAADYADAIIAQRRAAGATAAELARLTAEMNAFRAQYADPLYRVPMTFTEIFPVGVLVSLISAGLLRNPRFLPTNR